MNEHLRQLFARLKLFPCPLCGGDGRGENRFCKECEKLMHRLLPPYCPGCGGELDTALAVCRGCMAEKPRPWRTAVSLYRYSGLTRQAVMQLKFHGRVELARAFGLSLAEAIRESGLNPELIVPVPLHITRLLKRSYNQSALIAGVTARELGVECAPLLKRPRYTPHQSELSGKVRRRNLRGALSCPRPEKVRGKRLLVVDDVFTTGSTLRAAAEVLLAAGAVEICVATIARTPKH